MVMHAVLKSLRTPASSRRVSSYTLFALTVLSSPRSSSFTWVASNSFLSIGEQTQQTSFASIASMRSESPTLSVVQFPCLSDNYGFLVHDPKSGWTAAVDVPCAKTYKEELDRRGWKLTHILNTHHHYDHTGGNLDLKRIGDVTIIGPKNERQKIPGIDIAVEEGDVLNFAGSKVVVMDAGGHTKGHISYYFPDQSKVFVGDCIFSLGCGRMSEGTPEQFWASLVKHRALPDETMVYCAHEYTEANAKFALSVEPGNIDLIERVEIVKSKRSREEPTVPTLLGEEKKTNPFLRVDLSEEICKNIGASSGHTPAQAFGKLRKAKDNF